MAKSETQKIKKELSKELDSKRYEHTLGVAYTASCLAMRYDYDITKAYIAGLLHDCAKCMSHNERINYCKKNNLEVTEIEKTNPSLLHAKVGADLSKRKYGIEDEEICSAVRYHTTGRPNMTLLEKLVYLADYMEPNRTIDGIDELRRLTWTDPDEALAMGLEMTMTYVSSRGAKVDPHSAAALRFLQERKQTHEKTN